MDMNNLPQDCIAAILSLTSPADAYNSLLVSSTFRSAADSDFVWEKLLPSDYRQIVSKSINKLSFSSKKELYQCLCEPISIDNGKQNFKIEKSTGRKSYILSARELSISMSDDPMQWAWSSVPESRFSEVLELISTSRLEICGQIRTANLTPNTKYGAYLIMKTNKSSYGLDLIPSQVSITIEDNQVSSSTSYLCSQDTKKQQMEHLFYGNRARMLHTNGGQRRVPSERGDGWKEIEIGEFYCGENDEEVKMSLMEVKGYQLKGGLVVEGIEVRPKTN